MTACACAIPQLAGVVSLVDSKICRDSIRVPKFPFVRAKFSSSILKLLDNVRKNTMVNAGISMGMVICRKRCHAEAPSMDAASYRSSGILFSPFR